MAIREEILKEITRIEKAVNWKAVYKRFKELLAKGYEKQAQKAYKEMLELLEKEKGLSADNMVYFKQIFLENMSNGFMDEVNSELENIEKLIYHKGMKDATPKHFRINYDIVDKKALKAMHNQNIFFIGEYYEEHDKKHYEEAFKRAFETGMTPRELAHEIANNIVGNADLATSYFEGFAEHNIHRLREFGAISGYQKAGIKSVRINAIIDGKTTRICREMNGRIIPVTELAKVRDKILAIKTEGKTVKQVRAALKRAVPLRSDANDYGDIAGLPTKDIISYFKGFTLPPFHYRCRTRTVAYFGGEGQIKEIKQGDRLDDKSKAMFKNLTKEEIYNKLDYAKNASYLGYTDNDMKDDFEKHGVDEFGLKTENEYLDLANTVRFNADFISAKVYKEEGLQFSFYSRKYKGYTVVGEEGEIRGCYGVNVDKMLKGRGHLLALLELEENNE